MADEMKKEEKIEESTASKNIVTIEDAGPCRKKVSIEIPEETIRETIKKDYDQLRSEAALPGFRKGRAPMRLLEKKFGEDVSRQVKVKLLADASDAAIKDNDIDMLGDPEIDYENIELPESGSMKFEFDVEVRPEFELPNLEGIPVEKPRIIFDDKEVAERIMTLRRSAGIMEPKDGVVADGDQVIADVVLNIEGVEEDEKRENQEINVQEKGFVAGVPVENLNDLLAGAASGDKRSTTVEIPATFYKEEYRAKKIDVEIDIKEVKELIPAELNKSLFERFGVDDEDDLKDKIGESMEQQADREARTKMSEQIQKYLVDNTDFDLPESVIADQSTRVLQREYSNLLMQGRSKEEVEQQMGQLRASSEDQARDQLKQFFIMAKVADTLQVEVTEEEINGHIAQVASYRGKRPESMREELLKDGSLMQFSMQVREEKCIDKMLETAKITEVEEKKPVSTAKKKTARKKTAKKAETSEKKPAAKKKTARKKKTEDNLETKRATAKAKRKKTDTKKD